MGMIAGGCGSSMGGGEKLAENFSKTRGFVTASQRQVDDTLATLNGVRITNSTNLSTAFNQYKTSVEGLEKKGNEAKHLAATLKDNMDSNVMNWQKEMESIKDPSVRSSAESRRDAVKSNYEQVKMYAQQAREAYDPFLQDNKDIVKALQMNLSPASVSSLWSTMDKANADGKALKEKLSAMQKALDNIANGQPASGSSKM
jgi:hypothetical protein